jgi:type III restriction enzyme
VPIPTEFPKSPFEIAHPKDRWKPDINLSDKEFQHFYAPFVENIRNQIFEWRQFGYDGISETSKKLLSFWFQEEHINGFRYYFGQRESVESVIYLYEKLNIRHSNDLLKLDSWGITEDFVEDTWLRLVLKQATGTGKTKVLTLIMAWSYFHKLYEEESNLSKNFLLIAPNTIVLDRLKTDIEGLKIFNTDPIIPPPGYAGLQWQFNPKVHIQDDISIISDSGNIFLTNIQRFAKRSQTFEKNELKDKYLGPVAVKDTKDNKIKVRNIVKDLQDLIVLNDEAHHIHEDNAWKKSIEDIHNSLVQRGKVLPLQVDVTATPKHKKGEIFIQTISDYPLVEAIHQEVVKKPVIPDIPSRKKLEEHQSSIFSERYRDYINLGVETWQKQYQKHKKMGKKALLFIMVDDTKNCDDVANYLRTTFPELKNGTFVIHTKDNSKESTGEIQENSSKGKDELEKLRRLVNTVDDFNSPIKAIVSVLMLKEGWDVKNVTTIVGLRAYASHILPEQTLGRGLRRMYFGEEIDEELDVIGTDPFIDYVKRISEEGVELEEIEIGPGSTPSGPMVIEVDKENPNKDIQRLDLSVPQIPKRIGRDYLELDSLDPEKFEIKKSKLVDFSPNEREEKIIFRETIDNKEVKTIYFDKYKSLNSNSVLSFFTETILKELSLTNVNINHFIYAKIKLFIEKSLFEEPVEIDNQDVIRNLAEPRITHIIISTFKKEINSLINKDLGFRNVSEERKISDSRPYLSSRKKIYYHPKKSVFNLIGGDSKFEIEFCEYLDSFNDVTSFFKNDIQLKQSIEYIKHDGSIGQYFPDFFIKLTNGERWVVETKGAESLNDPRKFERLKVWCKDASLANDQKWDCLYIRQEIWNGFKNKPNTFDDLIKMN